MPKFPAYERDPSTVRPRPTAVEWHVPSTEPNTSEVDDSWFGESARHSFIAYKGMRNVSEPPAHSRNSLLPNTAHQELAYDVCDSPHALVVLVDLPDVDAKYVSLSLSSQALYLNVSVPPSDEPRFGVPAGEYEVRIETPSSLGPDTIDASLHQGLLRIRISKSPDGARRLTIVSPD